MTVKSLAGFSSGWLIGAFLFGLALPYLALLFHFAMVMSDWTPFDLDAKIGKLVSWAVPIALIAIFLTLMGRSALRQTNASKPLTGLLVFLSGIGCIGLGIFTALKMGLLPGTPSFV